MTQLNDVELLGTVARPHGAVAQSKIHFPRTAGQIANESNILQFSNLKGSLYLPEVSNFRLHNSNLVTHPTMSKLYLLQQAVTRNTLVPLVGAGVSMSVRKTNGERVFPSWTELLGLGAGTLRSIGKDNYADAVESMLKLKKFQDSADLIKEGLTGTSWQKFLRGVFVVEEASIAKESLSLPKAIWSLSNRIVTLNFEKILEISSPAPNDTHSLTNFHASELASFANAELEQNVVWHLHGRIEDISSVIFTGTSYEELYGKDSNYLAALEVLSSISRSSNILFVGCSLEDAELLSRINRVSKIFNDNTGPHFALVHKMDAAAVRTKLQNLPIEIIEFEDFGQPLLDLIYEISGARDNDGSLKNPLPVVNAHIMRESPKSDRKRKIAIFHADPIDKISSAPDSRIAFKRVEAEKHFFHLSIHNLRAISDFDYIFICTSILRGKILIEDDYGGADRISLSSLLENLVISDCLGVIIFVDQDSIDDSVRHELAEVEAPVAIVPGADKNKIASVLFKLFKKKVPTIDDGVCKSSTEIISVDLFHESVEIINRTTLPSSIDPKALKNFTGRSTDLKNIIRSSLELSGEDNILTIKGAGGVGKTAVVLMAAIELAKRCHFPNGIEFIDCEFISGCEMLETHIARFFDFDTVAQFREKIKDTLAEKDRLLILDNVETLIYLSDWNKIKELLSFICEYSMIIVTSREPLCLESEVIYELRRLTTDEATELFIAQLPAREISVEDRRIIREKIVEEILDNNPLAIKLITRNIPKGKNLTTLARELETSLFDEVGDEEINVFNSSSDENVERKRTLYASINYSYKKLNDREKNVFQLLSLFPDGVNMEVFKRIARDVKQSNRRDEGRAINPAHQFIINDTILKSLEDKSLIQSNNGHVRLQSLIGKFSDQKLRSRKNEELSRVYGNFFDHLKDFASKLISLDLDDRFLATKIFNNYEKNFLKCIEVSEKVPAVPESVCEYLIDILGLCINNCTTGLLIKAIDRSNLDYSGLQTESLSVKMTQLSAIYYNGNFERGLSILEDVMPMEKMHDIEGRTFIERDIAVAASNIYGMEGDALGALVVYERHRKTFYHCPDVLLQIGSFCEDIMMTSIPSFFAYEAKWLMGKLSLEEIDKYIDGLHEKNHLEVLQANYIRAKLAGKPRTKITKFVPVSPYTEGIRLVIMALCEKNIQKKLSLFKSALPNLFHIKYYYVEGILLFCEFLKNHSLSDFDEYFSLGLDLAKKHYYRHLIYRFEQVRDNNNIVYDEKFYPLPNDRDYGSIITRLIQKITAFRAYQ